MKINVLKSKIHRATVTDANLDYVGSLTLDTRLMDLAGVREYEKIHVLNITNGSRLETYIIPGGEGEVCINGAAAHLVEPGDVVIIVSYCQIKKVDAENFNPNLVYVNKTIYL